MLWKIICLVSFPVIALPFISGGLAPAMAVALTHQGQLSSQLVSTSVSNGSVLLSGRYDKDRDDDRECYREYQEAYRNIERDRRDLEDADSEGERRRYERKLDRDFRRLEDLRENYPDCDYQGKNREYHDYHGNGREYREYHEYHDYRDEPPASLLRSREIRPYSRE
ncbi:hypothetical protein G7B40_027240 [Aetokthonos hydrillicola Thurmond2011]|uniref:Secreted protein n=1 Tax=Aetokthonos hydrillicola Thurmond2011 TaxID=2712845 RepID=A0AAP5IDW8_9CYAN|nr:hypothetical protein [Aetokthonos hydrillicola]MBO3463445.1 hypothetical protein [Aetokthonos hydrillicola CCALA 1050]MBW4588946.1 hypothetical protein [Aetokthonos hydrillicola CCALA 1050]MDR9898227.1 hypothetical protein [Aetokthonos hydrillicola Thurmond2011]